MISGGGGGCDDSNSVIYLFTCLLNGPKANCKISMSKDWNTYTQITEDKRSKLKQ
jgi:hypothetical protein